MRSLARGHIRREFGGGILQNPTNPQASPALARQAACAGIEREAIME